MVEPATTASKPLIGPIERPDVRVLLVDDQPIVAEAIRRMLTGEEGIELHYCQDPTNAIEAVNRLEPTVILQDLVMPQVDGLTLLRFLRASSSSRQIPIIVLSSKEEPAVKAKAFGIGASDYIVKLPDKVELVARIRHHSRGYVSLQERNKAYEALETREKQLAEDMAQASKYVSSLLPVPLTGTVATDWRFLPCATLGGDTFGYHWIDDDHFAFYLLDVCGHGVKAALLSVSVLNAIRSQNLPNTDFRQPGQVLSRLNDAFPMERHFDMYFTMAYGIYQPSRRCIRFAGGGHPPGLLLTGCDLAHLQCTRLESAGPMVGAFEGMDFEQSEFTIDVCTRIFLYSDGVFEVHRPDGSMWTMKEFLELMVSPLDASEKPLERLLRTVYAMASEDGFQDDFSILELSLS